jgi:hypothetical protein
LDIENRLTYGRIRGTKGGTMKKFNYVRFYRAETDSHLDICLHSAMSIKQIMKIQWEYYPTWKVLDVNLFGVENEQIDQTGK